MIRIVIITLWALLAWTQAAATTDWPLCANGHPAKRPPDCAQRLSPGCITYGGLAPLSGHQRDHHIPEGLCRGQPWCDVAARDPTRPPSSTNPGNVWYQPIDAARAKDADEHLLEEAVCAGRITVQDAVAQIRRNWGQ